MHARQAVLSTPLLGLLVAPGTALLEILSQPLHLQPYYSAATELLQDRDIGRMSWSRYPALGDAQCRRSLIGGVANVPGERGTGRRSWKSKASRS